MGRQIRENSAVTGSGLVAGNGARAGSGNASFVHARVTNSDLCLCGGGLYGQCYDPLRRGERGAVATAELVAARYSAYAAHETDYIWWTWHPRYRPEVINVDDGVGREGLTIINAVDDDKGDREGTVGLEAAFHNHEGVSTVHERSHFVRRARRWVYVDGKVMHS